MLEFMFTSKRVYAEGHDLLASETVRTLATPNMLSEALIRPAMKVMGMMPRRDPERGNASKIHVVSNEVCHAVMKAMNHKDRLEDFAMAFVQHEQCVDYKSFDVIIFPLIFMHHFSLALVINPARLYVQEESMTGSDAPPPILVHCDSIPDCLPPAEGHPGRYQEVSPVDDGAAGQP